MGDEAAKIAGTDPDHAQRDLVESIESKDFPKWRGVLTNHARVGGGKNMRSIHLI